ncbi:hypothetical protein SAMN04487969_10740 [Paenibacillus algorifonticola]|uniref:Uncharacterized protein n=1 Tax=Paenibacillus algorifonticola TaxID=684063 RepID=A0A1I2DIU3_9BACL|nr:hypothetical protein [Paenibacillus algorifonticola]SFE80535.1 hypothetical protein SAMN04487969_10740 [Paenibacillus algorifonticola]
MKNMSYTIWIEAEQWENGWDIHDDNTDAIVTFENGAAICCW